MFKARTAWLVGEGRALDLIADALTRHGCRIERIAADQIDSVLEKVRGGDLSLLPNLILLSREAAATGSPASLETLATRSPWRLVPLVVVSGVEDIDGCREAYAAGASSWAVVGESDGEAIAEAFARYWLETAMLPSPLLPG